MDTPFLLIFDDGLGDFGPLCDLRPCFDIRSGALTTRHRIESALGMTAVALHVPTTMIDLTRASQPNVVVNQPLMPGDWLLVSGRITPHVPLPEPTTLHEPVIHATSSGHVLWAFLPQNHAMQLLEQGCRVHPGTPPVQVKSYERRPLWERPWHLLDTLEKALLEDLPRAAREPETALPVYVHVMGTHPVSAYNSRLQPGVVLNAELGPIVIEANTIIGAHSVIEGPCYVGSHAQLAAHTYLRPNTVIGPSCKFAGEISFTIVQGFSNKAHLGYLGHALVGEWVNLGAGTTVSNLKNTYGSVRMQLHPHQPGENTGRTFCGPVFGDFVRTAIGSRILTGSCLNTGAMIALSQFAPKCARAFGFYTDETPSDAVHEPEKFIAVARAMMARRKVDMMPALEQRLLHLMRS